MLDSCLPVTRPYGEKGVHHSTIINGKSYPPKGLTLSFMEYKNEYDQEEAVGQEEQAEEVLEEEVEQPEEDVVTLSKEKFNAIRRKAMAFDASKKQKPLPTREQDDGLVTSVKKLEMIEAKRQFGYENSLSPEETDFIFKFSNGKPDKTVLENPFVKSGLEGFRASKRVENNTPGSTSRSPIFQGKEFKEMTPEERQKSFEASAKAKGFA